MSSDLQIDKAGLRRRELLFPKLKSKGTENETPTSSQNKSLSGLFSAKTTRRTFEKQALAGATSLVFPGSISQAAGAAVSATGTAVATATTAGLARQPFLDLIAWSLREVNKKFDVFGFFPIFVDSLEDVPVFLEELEQMKGLMNSIGVNSSNVVDLLPKEHPPTEEHFQTCIYCRGKVILTRHQNFVISTDQGYVQQAIEISQALDKISPDILKEAIRKQLGVDYRQSVYRQIPQVTVDTPVDQIYNWAKEILSKVILESRTASRQLEPYIEEVLNPLEILVEKCEPIVRSQEAEAINKVRESLTKELDEPLPFANGKFVFLDRNDDRILDDWPLVRLTVARRNEMNDRRNRNFNVKLHRIELERKDPIDFAYKYAIENAWNSRKNKRPKRLGIVIGVVDLKPRQMYQLELLSEELQRAFPLFSVSFFGAEESVVSDNSTCAPSVSEWFINWGKEFNYGPIITAPKIETPYWLRGEISDRLNSIYPEWL